MSSTVRNKQNSAEMLFSLPICAIMGGASAVTSPRPTMGFALCLCTTKAKPAIKQNDGIRIWRRKFIMAIYDANNLDIEAVGKDGGVELFIISSGKFDDSKEQQTLLMG